MNSNILYLVHITHDFNNSWKYLKPSNDINDQFPGVFFSLITRDNIKYENLYIDDNTRNYNILIFSKKLLEQENYHINFRDYNGFINETNTYYPWELDTVVKKIKGQKKLNDNWNTEVVFHDKISLDYLCVNITIPNPYNLILNSQTFNELVLPKYEVYNDILPDKTKKPFYCHAMEFKYSGINPLKKSSENFYKKMAIMCNVDNNLSREEIIDKINLKIEELYNNREKQQLSKFKSLIKSDKNRNTLIKSTNSRKTKLYSVMSFLKRK